MSQHARAGSGCRILPLFLADAARDTFCAERTLTFHMNEHPGPSHFQAIFEAAFRDYEKQTGKTLTNHPLAEKLQNCDSVESVSAVLRDQTEEIRGKDKVLKPLKNVLSVLHKLSSASALDFGRHLGLVRPYAPIGFPTSLIVIR